MKNLSIELVWIEFKTRQWEEDCHNPCSPARWFSKDGLATTPLNSLETCLSNFKIYSTDPFYDLSETIPQTVVDAKTLSDWIDEVEMKYKLMRL